MLVEDVEPGACGASWLETVFAPLWRIFHVTRYGVLEGVTIDLRHPELDAWEWCINTLWTDPDFGWQQGPNIWFPWFGPPDLVGRAAQALRWAETSAHSFDDWSARLLPTVEVTTGCTVKVARVEVDRPDGREFEHEHDAETRLAYLTVICSDGREVRLERPLRFRGSTSFGDDPFNSGVTLDKVSARICGMFDIRSIDSYELIYATNDASDLALMEAKALVHRAERWSDSRPEGREGAGAPLSREALMELIDAAVSLGYRYAQAEAQRRILPFAEGRAAVEPVQRARYRRTARGEVEGEGGRRVPGQP